MGDAVTPKEFVDLFMAAYRKLDRDEFVTHVLDDMPRENDSWQDEKFYSFQAIGYELSRLAPKIVENIIHYVILNRS